VVSIACWSQINAARFERLYGAEQVNQRAPKPVYGPSHHNVEVKIHDLLMEGVELALKKRGYPTIAEMKGKSQDK
jgi:hypothetical protein